MQIRILGVVAVIGLGVLGIWGYQIYSTRYPSTEDAYVSANVVRVAPRVSGRITVLPVTNHQFVNKGDLLFTVDSIPFVFAVQLAQAQLALASREMAQAEAAVASAEAELNNRQVLLGNAKAKLVRAQQLTKKNYISNESVTDAEADYKSAQASVQVEQAKLEEARRQLGKPGDENDRIVQANATLSHAQWNLDNTRISAACGGQISELNIQPGNVVNADKEVFVLVCSDYFWIDANFKETQMQRIRSGEPVDIHVDMYPDHAFQGFVASVSGAAGSVFSLLPPQNANGNWVKVTQRIPVRITITNPDPDYPLLVGASTTVTIDTTQSQNTKSPDSNATQKNAAPVLR